MSSSNSPDLLELSRQIETALWAVRSTMAQTLARAQAMDRLLYFLQQHPDIRQVRHQDYRLALNQTWEWLSRNIDEFRPTVKATTTNDLIKWINGHLYWRIHDIYHPTGRDDHHLSLDNIVMEDGQTYLDLLSENRWFVPSFSSLSHHIADLQRQQQQSVADQIEAWIAADPERLLQSCYPRTQPHCHCQELANRLLLKDPPDSLKAIAESLEVPYQTLVAHWKRKCLPLLQQQAQEFGYEP
jgi:hypothetical protein